MQQSNDQMNNNTFYYPFAQQNQNYQRAMGNSTQYMQGDFQNPFGNSPQVNNPMPSWNQQSYDPNAQYGQPMGDPTSRSPATWSDADLQAANQAAEARARQQASAGLMDGGVRYYRDPATGKVLSDSMSGRGQDAAANWEAGEAWRAKNPTPTPVASRQPTQTSIASYPQPTDTGDFSARPGVNSPQSPAPYAIPDTDLFRNLVHKPADFGSNGQYGQPMGDALPPPRQWDYSKPYDDSADRAAASAGWKRFIEGGAYNPRNAQYWDGQGTPPWSANPGGGNQPAPQASTQGWAQPVQSPSQGTPYDPVNSQSSLPAPPAAQRPFNLRTMAKTQLPPKRKLPRPRGRGR